MSKGDWRQAQHATVDARIKVDERGLAIGIVGPDGMVTRIDGLSARPSSREPAPLFGGKQMSLAEVSVVSGSPTLTIELDDKGTPRLKVVTGAGVAAQLSFSGLQGAYFGGDCYVAIRGGYETGLSSLTAYFAPGATIATNYVLSGALSFSALQDSNYLSPGGENETLTWRTGKKNNSVTGTINYPFVIGSHKLVITPVAATVATVYIYAVGIGAKNRKGRCVVMADDGDPSWFKLGAPLFADVGIPTTAALIASIVGGGSAGTLEQWKAYVGAGNAVIAHGPNVGSLAGNLIINHDANAARIADMEASREFIDANGLGVPGFERCYAWPQGRYQAAPGRVDLLEAAYAAGFDLARGSSSINALVQYNADAATRLQRMALPYSPHGWGGSTAANVANITALVDAINAAATYGTDIFPTFHIIVPDATADGAMDSAQIRISDFLTIRDAIAAAVSAGTLECLTLPGILPSQRRFWGGL